MKQNTSNIYTRDLCFLTKDFLFPLILHRIAGPKVEELITTWKNYTAECHQRVVQCKVGVLCLVYSLGYDYTVPVLNGSV